MYLLVYYDEKDCQVTLLEPVFFKTEQAWVALKEKTVEHLKQWGCACAEKLFQKALNKQGYCIDGDIQIEINVKKSAVYIKTEKRIPHFATFQILLTGNAERKGTVLLGRRERDEKIEKLFEIFKPAFTILGTADIRFSTELGYSMQYLDTQQGNIWKSHLANEPEQMAKELLKWLQYEYCYLLGLDSMLPDATDNVIEEFEYIMPHAVKAPYKAFVKSMERDAKQILVGNGSYVQERPFGDSRIQDVLRKLVSHIRSVHGLLQLKERHIYEEHIERLIRIYKEKYGRVYLGSIRGDEPAEYKEYTGSEAISDYEFFIPYADQEILKLLEQWKKEDTGRAFSYYYQMHERFFKKDGIWYGWNF